VTFTLTVRNNGDADAENVVVEDVLPAFLDITGVAVSPLGPSVTIVGNTVTIGFGTLTPTDLYTVTISTVVNALASPPGGTNIATLTTDSDDDNLDNNEASAPLAIVVPGEPEAPATGFQPGRLTVLPSAPSDQPYVSYGDLSLEIPALDVEAQIVGVPRSRGGWEVAWLWDQAGYLNGTAFPTWPGNSVITAHVTLPDGTDGPFAGLERLRYGDVVILYGWGLRYVYAIREVDLVEADDPSIFRHEERTWVTLLTCYDYDAEVGAYRLRVAAHAVLLAIEQDGVPSGWNYDASGLPPGGKAHSAPGSK
jgi:LPXTG-site transpeptidase (sortase) family protein